MGRVVLHVLQASREVSSDKQCRALSSRIRASSVDGAREGLSLGSAVVVVVSLQQ
jgi:hypothetical protein